MGIMGKIFRTKSVNRIKSVIGFIVFIVFMAILSRVFCSTTYLFRNTSFQRNHIVGIKNEDLDLDMIYIGGSASFRYWQPLKAWNDYGFTSYVYGTASIPAESIKAYIEEIRTIQEPELYVIGVRAFQYYSDEPSEAALRNGTDSMDLTSYARYKLLSDYFKYRNILEDTDIVSYYLDVAKYHTNTGNLGSSLAWGFIGNNGISPNKGYEWTNDAYIESYSYLERPQEFETNVRASLPENAKKILTELLEYCKAKNLNVLFVVCPYHLPIEDQEKYNAIADIIGEYGYNYLNTNTDEYYDEMNIDFSTDFYDRNHVNLFGAAKYTEFLEKYIAENYDIPDHRNDNNYSSWNDNYNRFAEEGKMHAETATDLRLDVEKGLVMAEQMQSADNLAEWYKLVEDGRYTILLTVNDNIVWPDNIADQKILGNWGVDTNSQGQIRIVKSSSVLYSNATDQAVVNDGNLGIWSDIPYHISVENKGGSIIVNGEEMSLKQSGINAVVFDNNYRKVVDSVVLRCENEGNIHLYRE